MPTSLRRLTALAMARAMLAGSPLVPGLAARLRACLGLPRTAAAPWLQPLAERCARLPGEHWRRLTPRTLATLVERDAGFVQAWRTPQRPTVHRHLLEWRPQMQPAPLGLQACRLPALADNAALATWLRITPAGLWRLALPAAWQRRNALGQQHHRSQLLAKRRGGWRLLEVPHPHLQALQRRVLHGLLDAVPPHEAACGFTRGRSVLDHARAHAGQPVLLCFDLQDFFTSVQAGRVHALFTTLGYPEGVARSLTRLCTVATPEPVLQRLRAEGGLPWVQCQRLRSAHLAQGAPTSPALANLCAFGLDMRLAGLAHVLGARYTRYADDIVLSGGPHLAARAAHIAAWVGRIALEEGFALNHRKTRTLPQGRQQAVCGVVVNQHPNLPRAEFDRLRAVLHQCVLHGPAAQNREGHPHWRAHLQGRVAWAVQVNATKGARLQRLLAQVDWAR